MALSSKKGSIENGTDIDHPAECGVKSRGAKNDLRRTLYFRGCLALLLMILGSGFQPAHAETFKFESKTSLKSYTATIGGELSFPRGSGPFPAVILLHDCGGMHPEGVASLSAYARSLRTAGFATYILDSFSARGLNAHLGCDGPKGREASEFRLDDLFNARDALQKHPKVDKSKFFAMGQSHGATVALWAAVNLVNRDRFRAVAAFYPDCRTALLHSFSLRSPVIVFVGGKDDWTPAPPCEEAKQRERPPGGEIELAVYPDAYHAFDQQTHKFRGHVMVYNEQATATSRKRMLQFFVRYLRDESPSGSSSARSGAN
jgi:dienelactone hydrolase